MSLVNSPDLYVGDKALLKVTKNNDHGKLPPFKRVQYYGVEVTRIYPEEPKYSVYLPLGECQFRHLEVFSSDLYRRE